MPEVLKDAGLYFDPENPIEIANAIRQYLDSPGLRTEKSNASFSLAKQYSWERCADQTLGFLAQVASQHSR
jgi:glycosyltransferase involved in cell wall biosynthesis